MNRRRGMATEGCLKCRTILWWMVFSGAAINFMMRVHLNLVMVAVVVPPTKDSIVAECGGVAGNNTLIDNHEYAYDNSTQKEQNRPFKWNEYEQGLANGAFYWFHMLTELPGGILARKYGTKLVFGMGNLSIILLSFLIPSAMKLHLYALITVRVIQGFTAGVVFPSMHALAANWVPQDERSNFVSAYLGGGIGIGLTYPLCSLILHFTGWEAVFYILSLIGVLWYVAWYLLVFDSPNQHPRISEQERTFILSNVAKKLDHATSNKSVPWKHILMSVPLWVTILASWSAVWGYFTLLVQAPAYFFFIHGWSLKQIGILSGIPYFLSVGFGWGFAQFSDWLLRSNKMSLTHVRKLAGFCSTCAPALMVLGLSFSGCHPILAICFMLIGVMLVGSVTSGPMANLLDLSPNYASILLGIAGFIVDSGGFFSPLLIGFLLKENQTIQQWQLVFMVTAVIMAVGFVFYAVWGTADQQSWDSYQTVVENVNENEMKELGSEKPQLEENTPLTQ